MVTFLLVIIYLAFLGLGLPDGLLGSSWSVLRLDIGATTEMAGYISLTVSSGTVISSLFASKLLHKFGTGKVTLGSIFLTAIALTGISFSDAFIYLILLAIPLGLGAGCVDAALSNYVALHFKAKHMSWLHCFWGVGAMTGPIVMSYWLRNGNQWRAGFITIAIMLTILVLILLFTLSLWKIFEKEKSADEEEAKVVSNKEALRIPGVKMFMLTMLCYNGTEAAVSLWIATFLIESKQLSPASAAALSSIFFIGIIIGRLVSGFLSTYVSSKHLIRYGGIIGCVGFIILITPVPYPAMASALFIIGFGGAPVYPSIVHATPERFGEKASPSVIGLEMASAYVGATLTPLLVGLIATQFGMFLIPILLLLLFIIMFIASEMGNRVFRQQKLN
ncbi:fucose permease [Paenibacillus turicensis]|uniref:Fucose permease n=1 Tax=Paenibacillus turicensis TaxID=160487 RepID=A0ABS4FTZ2_9BACL|nr:MFS transporter [Paenibacillus turicensis]MBP1906048.1 fucose permease [Paenibacillus turicensis]